MRNFYRNNSNHFRGRNTRTKYINPALFVKKAENQVKTVYIPKHSFAEFTLCAQLKQNVSARGHTTPTPIQDQGIPLVLEGKDVIGIANTGTGKTAAFLLPLINKVFNTKDQRVLIIAPTRELAVQIDEEFRTFARQMGIFSALCIGGMSIGRQIGDLQRKPAFVIGTPGRLKDLEQRRAIRFEYFNSIVLDEVDRMLDMGFINDIKYIISHLPQNRQSLFFSATLPKETSDLAQAFLSNPINISVQSGPTSANVEQDIVKVNGKDKIDLLHDLLIQKGFDRVLVFGRTKWGIEKLARALAERGFQVASIHGNKSQHQR
ncbi:MAG: DEAD/DEAH box helicase [Patescibacteria group bacterium]|jgi:ATP-dependent RNA helicase RhlE